MIMIMMMMMTMMLMMVMNFQCKEIQFNDLNASGNIDQGLALRAHAQIPGVVFVFLFGCFLPNFWLATVEHLWVDALSASIRHNTGTLGSASAPMFTQYCSCECLWHSKGQMRINVVRLLKVAGKSRRGANAMAMAMAMTMMTMMMRMRRIMMMMIVVVVVMMLMVVVVTMMIFIMTIVFAILRVLMRMIIITIAIIIGPRGNEPTSPPSQPTRLQTARLQPMMITKMTV